MGREGEGYKGAQKFSIIIGMGIMVQTGEYSQ